MHRFFVKSVTFGLAGVGVAACDYIPGTEASRLEQAQASVRDLLSDPTSAMFKEVRTAADGGTVCGEVNGKNQMGAYTGFTRFYTIELPNRQAAFLEPIFDSDYLQSLDQACAASDRALVLSRQAGFPIDPGPACSDAQEYRQTRTQWLEFVERWNEQCEA